MIEQTDWMPLLPHRAPMVLLTDVISYDEHHAHCVVHINTGSPFFDAELNGVPTWTGLEYMAQAIGIWAGHQQQLHHKPVQAGFLLGCRQYHCNTAVFPVDCTLAVHCAPVYCDDSGLGAFDCRIRSTGLEATAQIKAFRPENPKQFVRPFSLSSTGSLA